MMDKSSSIVIVGGGGTFGLSTAWYLSRAGYTNIHCLDRWHVPSPSSAGYDHNRIVRTEYSHPVYSVLAQEAIELWRDPLFKDVFHETGWIFGTDGTTELGRASNFFKSCENTKRYGDASKIIHLPNWEATVAKLPVLASDSRHKEGKADFQAIFNGNAGWVDPVGAMLLLKRECEKRGVKFTGGPGGTVVSFLKTADGKTVSGVETADGAHRYASKIILAAGSYCDTLLDFKGQLQATAYVVTHLRLTEEQYERYRDMPVLNISRRGYCFPPNQDRILKICNTDISYVNIENLGDVGCRWGPVSLPRDPAYHPTDTQPIEAEAVTRKFTKFILSELAEAEIESSRLCWDMESHDYNWLIDYHPDSPETLLIATGGSGHSFKNIVNVGKYIMQRLEGTLDDMHQELWRWRPDRIGKDPGSEERASRPKLELKEAVGWKHPQLHL